MLTPLLPLILLSYILLYTIANPLPVPNSNPIPGAIPTGVPYTYTPHDLGLPTLATPWDEHALKEIERMRFVGWTEVSSRA